MTQNSSHFGPWGPLLLVSVMPSGSQSSGSR